MGAPTLLLTQTWQVLPFVSLEIDDPLPLTSLPRGHVRSRRQRQVRPACSTAIATAIGLRSTSGRSTRRDRNANSDRSRPVARRRYRSHPRRVPSGSRRRRGGDCSRTHVDSPPSQPRSELRPDVRPRREPDRGGTSTTSTTGANTGTTSCSSSSPSVVLTHTRRSCGTTPRGGPWRPRAS